LWVLHLLGPLCWPRIYPFTQPMNTTEEFARDCYRKKKND
jgi:hypothetical protein